MSPLWFFFFLGGGGTIWSSEIKPGAVWLKRCRTVAQRACVPHAQARDNVREALSSVRMRPQQQRPALASWLAVLLTLQWSECQISVTPTLWHPSLENVTL